MQHVRRDRQSQPARSVIMPSVPNGRILGQPAQVAIHEHRIIVPALVQLQAAGHGVVGCDHSLMIVDVPHGVAWHVPTPERILAKLVEDIQAAHTSWAERG